MIPTSKNPFTDILQRFKMFLSIHLLYLFTPLILFWYLLMYLDSSPLMFCGEHFLIREIVKLKDFERSGYKRDNLQIIEQRARNHARNKRNEERHHHFSNFSF